MTSGSIILSHSGDCCFACCVGRVFWVVSVIVLSSFIICGPPYSGTHTKSLMCINAEEGVKAKDQKWLQWKESEHCIWHRVQEYVANVPRLAASTCLCSVPCDVLFPFRCIGRLGSINAKYLRSIGVQSRSKKISPVFRS